MLYTEGLGFKYFRCWAIFSYSVFAISSDIYIYPGKTKHIQIIFCSRIPTTLTVKSEPWSSLLTLSWRSVHRKAGEGSIKAAFGPAGWLEHASIFVNVTPQLP